MVDLPLVLLLVESVCGRLPNVYQCISHWLLCYGVQDSAVHVCDFSVGDAGDDARSVLAAGSVVAPEGAEDCARGRSGLGLGGELGGDFVDEAKGLGG